VNPSHDVSESVEIQFVQLEHKEPMSTVISVQRKGAEEWTCIELTGRPGPELTDCHVDFDPARVTCAGRFDDPNRSAGTEHGVLVEATVQRGGELPTIRFVWFGRYGKCTLVLHECKTGLEPDELLEADPEDEQERRKRIVSGVEKWLRDWTPNLDREKPPLTFEEAMDSGSDSSDSMPLAEMLGRQEYSPVGHLPADFLEEITLGELAKLAQLQLQVHPCEHARLPHLYVYLTTRVIPESRISRRLPHPGSCGGYLSGDDCPDCAIEGALEAEGVEF
jgi:hypothetical protein